MMLLLIFDDLVPFVNFGTNCDTCWTSAALESSEKNFIGWVWTGTAPRAQESIFTHSGSYHELEMYLRPVSTTLDHHHQDPA